MGHLEGECFLFHVLYSTHIAYRKHQILLPFMHQLFCFLQQNICQRVLLGLRSIFKCSISFPILPSLTPTFFFVFSIHNLAFATDRSLPHVLSANMPIISCARD